MDILVNDTIEWHTDVTAGPHADRDFIHVLLHEIKREGFGAVVLQIQPFQQAVFPNPPGFYSKFETKLVFLTTTGKFCPVHFLKNHTNCTVQ